MDRNRKNQKGVSLIESLISMSIFCLVMLSSMEVFQSARIHFKHLKHSEETNTSAYAALDKMKRDISFAGAGLIFPMSQGWLKGVEDSGDRLIIRCSDLTLSIQNDLQAGQTWIPQASTKDLKKGQEIFVFDQYKGELNTIISVENNGIAISSPLEHSYIQEEASLLRARKIAFYMDQKKKILRRKVNASPAQPLCEDVFAFNFIYNTQNNLIDIHLCLNSNKETTYDLRIYPKNPAIPANN